MKTQEKVQYHLEFIGKFKQVIKHLDRTFTDRLGSKFELISHKETSFTTTVYYYIGDEWISITYPMKDVLYRSTDSYVNEVCAKFLQKKSI